MDIWRCRTLRLTDDARSVVFPKAKIWGVDETLLHGGGGVGEEPSLSSEEEIDISAASPGRAAGQQREQSSNKMENMQAHAEAAEANVRRPNDVLYKSTVCQNCFMIHELDVTNAEVRPRATLSYEEKKVTWLMLQVVLFPLGTGLLILHLDWLLDDGSMHLLSLVVFILTSIMRNSKANCHTG